MTKTTLTIGLFDKNTEKQEIKSPEAISIISNTLLNKFDIFAFTMTECKGVYKMNSTGNIVFEPSIKVEIATDEPIEKLPAIIADIKTLLNQESVMVEVESKDISFV
jgi:hypothetical protein